MPREDTNPFAWRPPTQEARPKSVLLVEDEPATMRFYQTGLKGLQGWRLLGAENGERALAVLRKEAVDVLVTDLNMPVMDGYRLIAEVHGLYPSIPIIVLTSLPEGEPQDRALALGALRVLSKPVRLSLLMEEIKLLGSKEPAGMVKGVSLGGLLQLMSWEGKTCTLTVKCQDLVGQLYVLHGRLIHAISGSEDGIIAAYQILTWKQSQIEFVEACRVEPTIDLPIEEILMNVAMIEDHFSSSTKLKDPWGNELQ